MKKIISIAMLAAAVVLSSCSKQDEGQPTDDTVRLTINTQTPQNRAAVRATTADLSRFIIEVYEGNAIENTPPTQHIEQANGQFTLTLKKNRDYCFLYWADKGTPNENTDATKSYYNASSLQAITAVDNTIVGQLAYCGATFGTLINSGSESIDVTLRHAVAQLVYDNTMAFTSTTGNSLQIAYPHSETFNVSTGKITVSNRAEVIRTYPLAAESIDKTVGVIATDYIFAPVEESQLKTIKMKTTIGGVAEQERPVANVPIRLNYTTRIKGPFSNRYNSSFSVSSSVDDMEENDHPFN